MALASAALGAPFGASVVASLSGRLRGVARATPTPRGEHLLPRPPGRFVRAPSRSAVVTWASAEDRFAHVRPGDPDPRNRADIAVGAEVDIVLKADQSTGRLTRGVVREFLTNSKHHPQGIKVRLVDGAIGRVERIVSGSAPGSAPDASEPSTSSPKPKTPKPPASSRGRAASPDASATVYLTNVPKALGKADVRWLLEEIPGVAGLRLPKRGGKNMGYAFVTCDDAESAAKVIETLNGMELEGKALVAEPAREKTRTASSDAAADGKKKAKANTQKGKAWKRGGKGTDEREDDDEDEDEDGEDLDPIARARREMEAEAILELERARRAGERRMREAEERARVQREKEAAAEARTTAMLAERRRRAEEAAAAAEAKRAREAALREEAEALGPIRVDPAWEEELVALAEELAALRSAVE